MSIQRNVLPMQGAHKRSVMHEQQLMKFVTFNRTLPVTHSATKYTNLHSYYSTTHCTALRLCNDRRFLDAKPAQR